MIIIFNQYRQEYYILKFETFIYFVFFIINIISKIVFTYITGYVFILIGSGVLIFNEIYFTALKQLSHYLRGPKIRFTWSHFKHFNKYYQTNLIQIFHSNKITNKVFLCIVICHLPINTYLTNLLLFSIHFAFSKYAKLIHQPAKQLIHLFVLNQHKVGNFRLKFQMVQCIWMMHTNAGYGFTYISNILITVNSFVKV